MVIIIKRILTSFLSVLLVLSSISISTLAIDNPEQWKKDIIDLTFSQEERYSIFDLNGNDITELYYSENLEKYARNDFVAVWEFFEQNVSRFYAPDVVTVERTARGSHDSVTVIKQGYQYVREELQNMVDHNLVAYDVNCSYVYDSNEGVIVSAQNPVVSPFFQIAYGGDTGTFTYEMQEATVATNKFSANYSFRMKGVIQVKEVDDSGFPIAYTYVYHFSDDFTITV